MPGSPEYGAQRCCRLALAVTGKDLDQTLPVFFWLMKPLIVPELWCLNSRHCEILILRFPGQVNPETNSIQLSGLIVLCPQFQFSNTLGCCQSAGAFSGLSYGFRPCPEEGGDSRQGGQRHAVNDEHARHLQPPVHEWQDDKKEGHSRGNIPSEGED